MLDQPSRPARGHDVDDYARFVLEAFGAADYELNLQTGALRASDRFHELYGYPADHPLTLAEYSAHHHPADHGALDAIIARAANEGQTHFQHEFRILRSDGTTRWVLSRGQVVPDDAGRPLLLRGAALDITERKQAEARLAISAASDAFRVCLGDTLRPLADPVAIQAEATRVLGEHLQAHRVAYFEVWGPDYVVERDYVRGIQPLRGRYPTEAFGPQVLAAYHAGRLLVCHDVQTDPLLSPGQRAAHAAIQIRAFIGVPLVKDGQFIAGLTVHHAAPRIWTDDEVALVAEVAERTLSAVTQARTEAALRESEERYRQLYAKEQAARTAAEEAGRLKDEFLATVSHELRTPLTALLGYAELLQSRNRDATYIARAVAKIRQSGQAQARLVEDLLDISRIVSGKLRLTPEPTRLAEVVVAAVETCASADEALAALRAAPPDVLICDIAMPGRDGYWLIEQVRRLPPAAGGAVPAIALTAYVQLEDRLRVLAAGYQQYVPKPVDSAELRDVIVALTALDGAGEASLDGLY